MESLTEHKAMLYSLLVSGGAVFALAFGASDDAIKQFELVVLPDEVNGGLLQEGVVWKVCERLVVAAAYNARAVRRS